MKKKSINEDLLQPIVKVMQENKDDKHYFNQSKYALLNYLRTQNKTGSIKLYENGAYADHIRTASRLTSGHSAEVDSYTLPIYIRTI